MDFIKPRVLISIQRLEVRMVVYFVVATALVTSAYFAGLEADLYLVGGSELAID